MQRILRHRLELLVCLSSLILLSYFAWQGLSGPRSTHYRDQLNQHYALLNAELAGIAHRRADLDTRVKMLRPESMDADLVDQLARQDLNMGVGGDIIVRLNE